MRFRRAASRCVITESFLRYQSEQGWTSNHAGCDSGIRIPFLRSHIDTCLSDTFKRNERPNSGAGYTAVAGVELT